MEVILPSNWRREADGHSAPVFIPVPDPARRSHKVFLTAGHMAITLIVTPCLTMRGRAAVDLRRLHVCIGVTGTTKMAHLHMTWDRGL